MLTTTVAHDTGQTKMGWYQTIYFIACIGGIFPSAVAFAEKMPFPPTTYESIGKEDALPEMPDAVLFVIVDETVCLDKESKDEVLDNTLNWIKPGRAIQVIRFSSVWGQVTDVVLAGRVDPEPKDSFIKQLKRTEREDFKRKHPFQIKRAKLRTEKAIRTVFGKCGNIPKSEILFNVHRSSQHIKEYKSPRKTVYMVSDMIENSSTTSFYKSNGVRLIKPDDEMRKARQQGLVGDFGKGVTVYITGLGSQNRVQNSQILAAVETFWKKYFKASKATVGRIGLPLLNSSIE